MTDDPRVQTIEDITINLSYLENLRLDPNNKFHSDYLMLIARAVHFFVYSTDEGLAFAPSRFIGYKKNSISVNKINPGNGGETDRAISKVVDFIPQKNSVLESEYVNFCTKLGIKVQDKSDRRKFWNFNELADELKDRFVIENLPSKEVVDNDSALLLNAVTKKRASVNEISALIDADLDIDINSMDHDGETPLAHAAYNGNLKIVKILVAAGANVNISNNRDESPLHWAQKGEVVEYLLKHHANVNSTDIEGATPLHSVDESGIDKIGLLIDAGANVNAKDLTGNTPLHYMAYYDYPSAIETFGKYDVEVDARNNDGDTALHIAVYYEHIRSVQALTECNANINAKNKVGATPLHIAAFYGYSNIVKILLEAKADVHEVDNAGFTAIFWATLNNQNKIIELLSNAKAKINSTDSQNLTPLHWAAIKGHIKVMNALIEAKANINARDINGLTPMRYAVISNQESVAKTLIEAGVKISNKHNKTCLHSAVANGKFQFVKLLIENNADVNVHNCNGYTPLIEAIDYGHRKIVKELIESGANVNAKDKNGFTPLHWAAEQDSKIVQILIDAGANINAKDGNSDTPLQLAKNVEYEKAVKVLKKAGAK